MLSFFQVLQINLRVIMKNNILHSDIFKLVHARRL